MITEFNNFLNENMTNQELLDNLKKAKYIIVEYNEKDKGWGIGYVKDGKSHLEGNFNTGEEAHEFLEDNEIDYAGKSGYDYMKKFRDKNTKKIPFTAYQRELMAGGIKDMLD